MNRIQIFVLFIIAIFLIGFFSIQLAQPVSAAPRCDTPGIVRNRSSKWMVIKYDNTSGQQITAVLNPNQVSTYFTCDADEFWFTQGSYLVLEAWNYGIFYAAYQLLKLAGEIFRATIPRGQGRPVYIVNQPDGKPP